MRGIQVAAVLAWLLMAAVSIAIPITIGYVALHFILKVW